MNQKLVVVSVITIGAALGLGAYFWLRDEPTEVIEPTPVAQPISEPPAEQYPVPNVSADKQLALPALTDSDPTVLDALKELFSADALMQHLVPHDIVRHFVVTIDNLPRKKVSERLKPIAPITGKFVVSGPEDALQISAENDARYESIIKLINSADMEQVATVYFRLYPLMQEAYNDLGYPSGYFNDRLVAVIDHLLATPVVKEPIQLVQPGVLYEYADPSLESLSAGQKALIRMGNDNATIVKNKLGELRAAVTKNKTLR